MRVRFAIRGELTFLDEAARERAVARFLAAADGTVEARSLASEGMRIVFDVAALAPKVLFAAVVGDLEAMARDAVAGRVSAAREGDDAVTRVEAGGVRETTRDATARDALLSTRVRSPH